MDNNVQTTQEAYVEYIDRAKKANIFQLIAHGGLVLLIAAMLFLPFLQYKYTPTSASELFYWTYLTHGDEDLSNSNIEEGVDENGNAYISESYSYFGNFMIGANALIKYFSEGGEMSGPGMVMIMMIFIGIIFPIAVIASAVMIFIHSIKKVIESIKFLTNVDAGTKEKYLYIKRCGIEPQKKNNFANYIKSVVMLFILDPVLMIIFKGLFAKLMTSSSMPFCFVTYSAYLSGVTFWVAFVAIFAVAAIVGAVQYKKINGDITNDINAAENAKVA